MAAEASARGMAFIRRKKEWKLLAEKICCGKEANWLEPGKPMHGFQSLADSDESSVSYFGIEAS